MKKLYRIGKEYIEVPASRNYGRLTDVAEYYGTLVNYFPELVEEYTSEREAREAFKRECATIPTLSYHPYVAPYWLGVVYTLVAVTLDEDGEEIEWENLDIAYPEYPDYAKREAEDEDEE